MSSQKDKKRKEKKRKQQKYKKYLETQEKKHVVSIWDKVFSSDNPMATAERYGLLR